ncbi:hypothetical protein Y032_0637g950 [Ancylostoma ceylanicum]|uniref:Endonuclease/exonuclease/phosphatase domain-containing protein n=1 Tax=Ancylostoma ceylanicum TaxID=53326 RepID=A0A016WJU5_9BILA|nr:hypothetical protein Y032_0637g950 [Ancylostoma ceylanicum]
MPALTVFFAYSPICSYDEDEIKAFYMGSEKFYREEHTFYKVIVGDFNTKIGPRRAPKELHTGTYGLQWNEQGESLFELVTTTKTIRGNSPQFQKPTFLRWMWESPSGGYHNKIDHIIVNRRFCLTESVLNRSSTPNQIIASFAQDSPFRESEKKLQSTRKGVPNQPSTGIFSLRWLAVVDNIYEE